MCYGCSLCACASVTHVSSLKQCVDSWPSSGVWVVLWFFQLSHLPTENKYLFTVFKKKKKKENTKFKEISPFKNTLQFRVLMDDLEVWMMERKSEKVKCNLCQPSLGYSNHCPPTPVFYTHFCPVRIYVYITENVHVFKSICPFNPGIPPSVVCFPLVLSGESRLHAGQPASSLQGHTPWESQSHFHS